LSTRSLQIASNIDPNGGADVKQVVWKAVGTGERIRIVPKLAHKAIVALEYRHKGSIIRSPDAFHITLLKIADDHIVGLFRL
jgi:hypothetical protein